MRQREIVFAQKVIILATVFIAGIEILFLKLFYLVLTSIFYIPEAQAILLPIAIENPNSFNFQIQCKTTFSCKNV